SAPAERTPCAEGEEERSQAIIRQSTATQTAEPAPESATLSRRQVHQEIRVFSSFVPKMSRGIAIGTAAPKVGSALVAVIELSDNVHLGSIKSSIQIITAMCIEPNDE